MLIAAGESSTQAWVVIVVASLSTIGAVGAAWAANTARRETRSMAGRNDEQHASVGVTLTDVRERQEWMIDQIAEIRQALLRHVMWEEGGPNVHVDSMTPRGKYHDIEEQLAAIQREVEALHASS